MTIQNKRPPLKETVGAQYICFAKPAENSDEFTAIYEEEVEKTEVVKSVNVSENTESTPVKASGKVYMTVSSDASTEISVEVIAFVASTLAKMRGDTVDEETGLVISGKPENKPFFAYGKVVHLTGGHVRYDWFPKCQLTSNTDEVATSEDKFSEQNETLTISAMPFDDAGNIVVKIDSSIKIPEGLTEDLYFSKPMLSLEDLKDVIPTAKPSSLEK